MRVRHLVVTFTTFLAIISSSLFLSAQNDAKPNLAVKPEVQTAAWAQAWWMPRHKEKLEGMKGRQVDLLMIGDSITHGWENGGRAVWEKYYAGRNAFNIGFSGDRTENVLWRLQHGAVDGIDPQLAIVMIGTNNTGHRQDDPKHTAAGIQAILDELHTRLPKMKVLLLGIFPRGAGADDRLRKINDATNEIIATYADNERVFYLDISDKFLDDDGSLPKSMMPDLLHPNADGYEIWAEAMEPTVKKLMGQDQ